MDEKSPQDQIPEIIIAADGSGATQALALLFNLKERYRQGIKHIILFSPWLNLSPKSPLLQDKKTSDELLSADSICRSSDIYTYSSNLENPFISPLFITEEPLKNFPPVYIQMGEKEKLEANGVTCTLDVWKNMMFMFQMADEYLEEAHLALEKIGKLATARKTVPEDFYANYSAPLRTSLSTEA